MKVVNGKLNKINWDRFKVKNENFRKAFEELSYTLFCRKFNKPYGISRHINQTGIETEPVKVGKELIGFQAKFFDSEINEVKITRSITKAKKKNPKLTKVIIYINLEFAESSKQDRKDSKSKTDINNHANKIKVKIEWVFPSNFEQILNSPKNLDLTQLYFDSGDEFGFISSNINSEIITFLQSSEYLELPYIDPENQKIDAIEKEILARTQKSFIIIGHPGSGKSISVSKLFQVFSGLNKTKSDQRINIIKKNQAIPMLINLKSCLWGDVENLIRARQNDFSIRNKNIGFIYILDGLDELDEISAERVLAYASELAKNEKTKKLIISCRAGSLNRFKAKIFFPQIIEYKIADLDKIYIDKYFSKKGSSDKKKLLKNLYSKNSILLNDIKDILLIKLLWETIKELNENSTIFDLLNKKMSLLVNHCEHRKNIEELNLLNPKEDKISTINQDISYHFQNKFQFQLSL